jgi:hypothetical protein
MRSEYYSGMALTDDHPIKVTASDYKPVGQGSLESWLNKEAESKLEAGRLASNADESTANYSELYKNPPGHEGAPSPARNNPTTYAAADKERHDVVSRAFGTLPAASAVDKALLAKNLQHAASGDYETHSVLLHGQAKQASLADRVKKVIESF